VAHRNVYNFAIIGDYCTIHIATTLATIKNLAAAFKQTPYAVGRSILNLNWSCDLAILCIYSWGTNFYTL